MAERGPNGEADPAGDDFPEVTLIEALLPQVLTMAMLTITLLDHGYAHHGCSVCSRCSRCTHAPCTYHVLTATTDQSRLSAPASAWAPVSALVSA